MTGVSASFPKLWPFVFGAVVPRGLHGRELRELQEALGCSDSLFIRLAALECVPLVTMADGKTSQALLKSQVMPINHLLVA